MNANDLQKAIHYLITTGVWAPSDLGDGDLIFVRYTMPQNVSDIQTHSSRRENTKTFTIFTFNELLAYTSSTQ